MPHRRGAAAGASRRKGTWVRKVLQKGANMVVEGLEKAPQYNGREAVVMHFDEGKGRYQVELGGGCQLLVRPANLVERRVAGGAPKERKPIAAMDEAQFEAPLAFLQGILTASQEWQRETPGSSWRDAPTPTRSGARVAGQAGGAEPLPEPAAAPSEAPGDAAPSEEEPASVAALFQKASAGTWLQKQPVPLRAATAAAAPAGKGRPPAASGADAGAGSGMAEEAVAPAQEGAKQGGQQSWASELLAALLAALGEAGLPTAHCRCCGR